MLIEKTLPYLKIFLLELGVTSLQVFDLFGSHNIAIDGFDLGIKANPLSNGRKETPYSFESCDCVFPF